MAKKHFLLPSRLVNKMPVLRRFIWMLEAVVVKSLAGLIRRMPPERAYRFTNALFRNLKPVLPFTKKIRRNLAIAFPHKSRQEIEQLTRAVCGNLGLAVADMLLAMRIWAERDRRIEFVMQDGVDFSGFHGRPAVLVDGHIGAWLIGTFVAAQYDLHLTAAYAPEQNPYLKDYANDLRAALPVSLISRDGCMRHLSKELRQGHMVGLISDARFDRGELVDFFGTPMRANTAAARLAVRYQCDLIPIRTERLDGLRFRITVGKPIRPADPGAPAAEQARQMTAELFKLFEAWIRADPAQWICFSRRWPQEAYAD